MNNRATLPLRVGRLDDQVVHRSHNREDPVRGADFFLPDGTLDQVLPGAADQSKTGILNHFFRCFEGSGRSVGRRLLRQLMQRLSVSADCQAYSSCWITLTFVPAWP